MSKPFNPIAGQTLEHIVALSDEIFAVGMTLLVLELRLPTPSAIHGEHDLERALLGLAPELLTYLMSFVTLGIFWVAHKRQLDHLDHTDRHLTWIHLALLFAVTTSPFSTKLLADFIDYRLALLVYWGNILVLGGVLYGSWRYAIRAGLLKEDVPAEVPAAISRGIVIAQLLYAVGVGLCLINTYWSIGFILLVQINYAVGPRYRRHLPD
jgi:uncharacterized membrane protein